MSPPRNRILHSLSSSISRRVVSSSPLVEKLISRVGEKRGNPVDLYHEIHGHGKHKVLFITGWAGSCDNWKFQTEFFGKLKDFQVCIYENRGSGYSSSPPKDYSMKDMAKDAYDLIQDLGWKKVHVVGVSMGGMIAQELALLDPSKITSLTLASTCAGRTMPPSKHMPWIMAALTKIALGLADIKDKIPFMLYSQRWLNAPAPKSTGMASNLDYMLKFHGGRVEDRPKQSIFAAVAQLSGIIRHYVSPDRLQHLRQNLLKTSIPALVVHGTEDVLVHLKSAWKLSQDLGARLVVFEGRGHALNHEDIETFNRLLLRHFYTAILGEGRAEEAARMAGWWSKNGIVARATRAANNKTATVGVLGSLIDEDVVAMEVLRAAVVESEWLGFGKQAEVSDVNELNAQIQEALKSVLPEATASADTINIGVDNKVEASSSLTSDSHAMIISAMYPETDVRVIAKKLALMASVPEELALAETTEGRLEWMPPQYRFPNTASLTTRPLPSLLSIHNHPPSSNSYSTSPSSSDRRVPTSPTPNPNKKPSTIRTALLTTGALLSGAFTLYLVYPYSTSSTTTVDKSRSKSTSTTMPVVGGVGLRKTEVDAVLRAREQVTLLKNNDDANGVGVVSMKKSGWFSNGKSFVTVPVVRFDMSVVPSNNPIEDYHCENVGDRGLVFGIFDGHGGPECAAVVSKYLASYVQQSLSIVPTSSKLPDEDDKINPKRKQMIMDAIKSAFARLDQDIINGGITLETENIQFSSGSSSGTTTTPSVGIMSAAVARQQQQLSQSQSVVKNEAAIYSHLRPAIAGSCALLAYIEGDDVFVAWSGDSRAVLGRRKIDGMFQTIQLSEDQTVKNPNEYSRLVDEHPGELETVVVRGRVLGGLMPTRAFGDARYKWPLSLQETILPHLTRRHPPQNYFTPPYVTAEPEVTHYRLDPLRDRFLVLATDGLYDELDSDEVVDVIAGYMLKRGIVKPPSESWAASPGSMKNWSFDDGDENAATCLVRNALGGGGSGAEEKIGKLLAIPSPYSRRFRDDITVNVIFFGDQSAVTRVGNGVNIGKPELQDGVPGSGFELDKLVEVNGKETLVVPTDVAVEEVDLNKANVKQHRLMGWVKYLAGLASKAKL
ncbi:hypothetical protein HDU76_012597 [Blyttiomyces sp. JEL0837]|nr:hypothetical protein HDU76_012597 [Blyttiomyces sp. JEL0837]